MSIFIRNCHVFVIALKILLVFFLGTGTVRTDSRTVWYFTWKCGLHFGQENSLKFQNPHALPVSPNFLLSDTHFLAVRCHRRSSWNNLWFIYVVIHISDPSVRHAAVPYTVCPTQICCKMVRDWNSLSHLRNVRCDACLCIWASLTSLSQKRTRAA